MGPNLAIISDPIQMKQTCPGSAGEKLKQFSSIVCLEDPH